MQHCVIVQEGFGVNGETAYYTNEPPTYEAHQVPLFAKVRDAPGQERLVHVGERQETFVHFTPVNGPSRRRGKLNCIPFTRLIAVIAAPNEEA